jgi:SAM-dependent methyltransferase
MNDDLGATYAHRFTDADAARKAAVWQEITRFLQRYVPLDAAVLDVACDRGAFINAIRAREKWAVDIRDVRRHLDSDVRFVQADGRVILEQLAPASMDTVFMSNYLEHLPTPDAVIEQMRVVHDVLRPGGRAIILQPNVRLVGFSYWDFVDHRTPLTDRSLAEAARLAGLETVETIVRFIPYTTKSWYPQQAWLVRLYLALRPLWPLFGRQTLYVARRPPEAP